MRILRAILAAQLALGLLACQAFSPSGGAPSAAASPRLKHILRSGELRVGVSADLPPLNMKDKEGEIVGFEIDVVRALAGAMGLDVRFVERPFAELLPTLEAGEVDLVVSGLTITPERNARVAFAGPYFVSGTSIVSTSEEIFDARSTRALDQEGRTYVALEGSTSATFVREYLPTSKLVTVSDYESAVRLVIDGQADGMVADYLACRTAIWRNPHAGLFDREPFTIEPLGIALPADSPLLLNLVSNYLNTLERSGLLAQYKAKWLADGSWINELP